MHDYANESIQRVFAAIYAIYNNIVLKNCYKEIRASWFLYAYLKIKCDVVAHHIKSKCNVDWDKLKKIFEITWKENIKILQYFVSYKTT